MKLDKSITESSTTLTPKPFKPQLSRFIDFYDVLSDVCFVLEYGEKKHGDDKNYLTYPVDKDIDAALRHIFDKYDVADEETAKLDIVHAIVRLMFAYKKL